VSESRTPVASKSSSGEPTSTNSFSAISLPIVRTKDAEDADDAEDGLTSEEGLPSMGKGRPQCGLLLQCGFLGRRPGFHQEHFLEQFPVRLPVAVVRHTFEDHPALWNHVARQNLGQPPLEGEGGQLVTRERHRKALEEVVAALDRATAQDLAGREDIIAEELRLASRALGRLTGRVDVEDILDVIFRDFCIGK